MIRRVLSRNSKTKPGVPRPHIQKLYKGTSFQYLVVPIDPFSEVPARTIVSNVPPHLALCTTSGKIMKAWGRMKGEAYTAVRLSVVERAKSAIFHDRPALSLDDLDYMRRIHRTWSFGDYVPPAFLSEDSDQTMVAAEESSDSKSDSGFSSNVGAKWEVGSSASCYHEPKPHPDAPTTNVRLFPSENGDEDDAISSDSHSGVDHEMDTWLKYWAEETAEADTGEPLLNDAQIEEDPKEQPRVAASLDLTKPDYL
ncbi:hypothetical protein B0H13DRAFT_2015750 [Mycena leptocephala]|nr:hypothetical protein B0H13DRAFT_2015750 [Mycena leptocephala]